jgi:hypothetical protein
MDWKQKRRMYMHYNRLEFKLYEWLYRESMGHPEAATHIRQLEWELAIAQQAIANTYRTLAQQLY